MPPQHRQPGPLLDEEAAYPLRVRCSRRPRRRPPLEINRESYPHSSQSSTIPAVIVRHP